MTRLSVSLISHPFDAAAYIKAVMFQTEREKKGRERKRKPALVLNRPDGEKKESDQVVGAPFLFETVASHAAPFAAF